MGLGTEATRRPQRPSSLLAHCSADYSESVRSRTKQNSPLRRTCSDQ